MAAIRRKQDDKNLEILRELITINGNKYCLDCNQRGPTYVNTTIGSFVCSKCSGMLRGLTPPHRVKSISMATFTPDEIEFIKSRGNDYCRRVWLGLFDSESRKFSDEQSIRDFMSDKYEKKRYYLEHNQEQSTMNGNASVKTKHSKTGNNGNTPLVSLSPPVFKPLVNNSVSQNIGKSVGNLLTPANEINHKIARPVNNLNQTFFQNTNPVSSATPVPDFPVDFSTANIYNSSQQSNSVNNNFMSQPFSTTPALTAFNAPQAPNDRYAALADLDLALRQQKMKVSEENNINNTNPFQSVTHTTDLFANKNPFFNGGWSNPSLVQVNPFMPQTNNGNCINSKNPFL